MNDFERNIIYYQYLYIFYLLIDDKLEPLDNEKKKGWPKFTNVFMVSSIEHTGLEELKVRNCDLIYIIVRYITQSIKDFL